MTLFSSPVSASAQRFSSLGKNLIQILIQIFRAPFHIDPHTVAGRTFEERDRDHRAALFRLILMILFLLLLCVTIPITFLRQQNSLMIVGPVSLEALTGISLLICRSRTISQVAFVFVIGGSLISFGLLLFQPAIDVIFAISLSIFPIYILLAGLVLPSQLLILVTGLDIFLTLISLLSKPHTLLFQNPNGLPASTVGIFSQVIAIQVLTAMLSWLQSQSAKAGLQATQQAYERERELALLKDQFIESINHELRTPIMAWYGNTEIAVKLNVLGKATPEQQNQLLQSAYKSGIIVLHLLRSVMDLNLTESTPLQVNLMPLALGPAIQETVNTFDPREIGESSLDYSGYRVQIEIAPHLSVQADPGRLRQIMTNLLSNAFKYADSGTSIEVTAKLIQGNELFSFHPPVSPDPEAMFVLVQVRDHGWGIPLQEVSHLFQRFSRLKRDIASTVRGTGIGLYLCKRCVEAMGGQIWIQSTGISGEGSTFYFFLLAAES
jgi:signal transduction histidine kinase